MLSAAFEIEYAADSARPLVRIHASEPSPDVIFMTTLPFFKWLSRTCTVLAGPMKLTFMWLDRESAVKVKLVCQWVAMIPALLSRKSISFSGPPKMEVACLLMAAIESCDPVSHSMIWRVAVELASYG